MVPVAVYFNIFDLACSNILIHLTKYLPNKYLGGKLAYKYLFKGRKGVIFSVSYNDLFKSCYRHKYRQCRRTV